MLKYLLLPSFAVAKPFITFSDLLKNMTFDKVDTNDHNNELVIDHWSDEYCQDYVYDSEYLPVQECFCDEGSFCAYIDTCHYDFFTLNLYQFSYEDYYKCHDSHYYEYLHIPTNQCQEGAMFHCTDPDTHDDSDDNDDNTRNLYDYIERKEYQNENCNGNPNYSEDYQIGECACNNDEGWCVLPLYCNNDFIEVQFYYGNKCSNNNYAENLKFSPNECFDYQFFECHNNDHGIHWVVAMCISIASFLCCCGFTILFLRCCFVQNPCGRSNRQQPQQVQVQQPPQIVVQQPQMVQQPQIYRVANQKIIIPNAPNAPNAGVPGEDGAVPPAYSTYPALNNGENRQDRV